jgi:hypothetical protein
MQIDSSVYNPLYDRDFSIESNCVKGGRRGNQPYIPPKKWYGHFLIYFLINIIFIIFYLIYFLIIKIVLN